MIEKKLVLVAILGSVLLLSGALAFQYIGGYPPCKLCYWQRYPHIIAIFFWDHLFLYLNYENSLHFEWGIIFKCSLRVIPLWNRARILARSKHMFIRGCEYSFNRRFDWTNYVCSNYKMRWGYMVISRYFDGGMEYNLFFIFRNRVD